MNIQRFMSGIAVVIDDAFEKEQSSSGDKIFQIVKKIENEWEIPCYNFCKIPTKNICGNLLQSASFILLDWNLWGSGGSNLQKIGIKANLDFLKQAKDYFVPVFIFTNEDSSDIIYYLGDLYNEDRLNENFIFIKNKSELIEDGSSDSIQKWLCENASVYALKAWECIYREAKKSLFSAMYDKSPDWPKVFWKAYEEDGVDPGSSMVNLISDNLLARMEFGAFEGETLSSCSSDVPNQDVKSVLEEVSFIRKENLPKDDIRAGDIFLEEDEKYLINIRADCDCIPRGKHSGVGDINLYCIKGQCMNNKEIQYSYDERCGNFNETIAQSIVFGIHGGKTVRFSFKELVQIEFSKMKDKRVGRLIHPYITRIQQRYALYLQRQALPRIPKEAIK